MRSRKGELDVLRYGSVLKARQLVGVRGAGMAFDGLYYVKSVTHTIKARGIQAKLLAQPQRTDLDSAEGAGMSDDKCQSTSANTAAPWSTTSIRCSRAHPGDGARRAGLVPSTWAMPCVAAGRKQEGRFHGAAHGAGVWVEFEQGDPDYPIWVGGFWGGSPKCRRSRSPAADSPGQTIVLQTTCRTRHDQRCAPYLKNLSCRRPRSNRRHHAKATGATISSTTPASTSKRQGRDDRDAGPSVTINSGALVVI